MTKLKAFTMPKWGIEMSEGTIAEWMVDERTPFKKGDLLVLVETDKITNELEAEADGCFVRLVAAAGEACPVGALIAVLGPEDASAADVDAFVSGFRPADTAMAGAERDEPKRPAPAPRAVDIAEDMAISPAARARAEASGVDLSGIKGSGAKGRISAQDVDRAARGQVSPKLKGPVDAPGQEGAFASPLARRLAVLNGIDLATVTGTGRRGRIRKEDVLALVDSAPPIEAPKALRTPSANGADIQPMSSMRRTIAQRLTEAKQSIPHFYLRRRVRADRLIALREQQGKPASLNDYLVRAAALALCEVPEVNIQVHGTDIHRFANADISVAVSTPKGLLTPIIFAADELSVAEIGTEASALAARARAGKLQPNEFQGGTFTVSNLGMFGVEQFDAIINPPQAAILAIGKARPEPIDDHGAIRIVPVLHLSLSCDHRAIDGADGARFLEAFSRLVEAPEQL